jgi:hypothetical protein
MPRTSGKPHHPYHQGGRRKDDAEPEPLSPPAKNRSWESGRKGQGGEGLSDGYGGSGGDGTGPSGPEDKEPR